MDREEYQRWKRAQEETERAYDPRGMRMRMPLGCILIPLAIAAVLIYILIQLNSPV